MSVNSLIFEYEKELNVLLEKGFYKDYRIRLKKGLVSFKSERSSIRYLRLWLYYAILVKNPIPIYQFLINNYIGTHFALLYEEIAFYYFKKGHILEAKHTLEFGIAYKAIPTQDLQYALLDLNDNDIKTDALPPSIRKPLPSNFLSIQQPKIGIGLGSMNLNNCLDAMKSYMHYLSHESSALKSCYFGPSENPSEVHNNQHLNNDKIDIKDNDVKLKKQKVTRDNFDLHTELVQKHNINNHSFKKLQLKDINSKNRSEPPVSSSFTYTFKNSDHQHQQKDEKCIDQIDLEQSSQIKNNGIDYQTNKKSARVLNQIENEIYLPEEKLSQKEEEVFYLEHQLKQYDDQDQIQQLTPILTINEKNNNYNDEIVLYNVKTPNEKNSLSNNNNNNNGVIIIHSSSPLIQCQSQQQQPKQQEQQLAKKTSPITIILPLPYDQKQRLASSLAEKYLINTLKHNIKQSSFNKVKNNWQKKKPQLIKVNLDEGNSDDYNNTLWLNSFIGSGRYGKVYGIQWRNQQLALKVQMPVDLWDYCILQYIHEQYSSSQWNPYVVKPHALFKDEKASYFIMDYLNQGTLYDCLLFYVDKNKTSIPEPLVQLFALRLLQAVASLHKIHVTHNDIKLDNIMINLCLNNNNNNNNYNYDNNSNNKHFELPLVYNTDDSIWKKQSIQLIDFGLAINLDFHPVPFLAKAGWLPSKKFTEMPAVQSRSPWIPFYLDYFSLANSIHILLHEKPLTNGIPSLPKRYWDKTLWDDFFGTLLHPTSASIDDGVSSLNNLISKFEHSLTYGQHNCNIHKHLLYFITHNYLQKQ